MHPARQFRKVNLQTQMASAIKVFEMPLSKSEPTAILSEQKEAVEALGLPREYVEESTNFNKPKKQQEKEKKQNGFQRKTKGKIK